MWKSTSEYMEMGMFWKVSQVSVKFHFSAGELKKGQLIIMKV